MTGLAERVAQPFQTLVETVSGSGAGGLDVLFGGGVLSDAAAVEEAYIQRMDLPRRAV